MDFKNILSVQGNQIFFWFFFRCLDNTGLSLDAWMMLVLLWICGALGLSKDSLDAWFFQMMLG